MYNNNLKLWYGLLFTYVACTWLIRNSTKTNVMCLKRKFWWKYLVVQDILKRRTRTTVPETEHR